MENTESYGWVHETPSPQRKTNIYTLRENTIHLYLNGKILSCPANGFSPSNNHPHKYFLKQNTPSYTLPIKLKIHEHVPMMTHANQYYNQYPSMVIPSSQQQHLHLSIAPAAVANQAHPAIIPDVHLHIIAPQKYFLKQNTLSYTLPIKLKIHEHVPMTTYANQYYNQ